MRRGPVLGLILVLLIALNAPDWRGIGDVVERTHIVWSERAEGFGGFSGFSLLPDGVSFLAVSDYGSLLKGILLPDQRVRLESITRLTDKDGHIYADHKGDAEGLAIGPDGTLFVSFEHRHKVTQFTPDGTGGTDLPAHPEFRTYPDNRSLESLAIDESGRLHTVSEFPDAPPLSFRVFRFDGTVWEVVDLIPARDRFRAVGADFGPDGFFYLLERKITPLGFQARIRRWSVTAGFWRGEETIWRSYAGQYGNLEGLSIRYTESSRLLATMISDDNFLPFLGTEIVQVEIKN